MKGTNRRICVISVCFQYTETAKMLHRKGKYYNFVRGYEWYSVPELDVPELWISIYNVKIYVEHLKGGKLNNQSSYGFCNGNGTSK